MLGAWLSGAEAPLNINTPDGDMRQALTAALFTVGMACLALIVLVRRGVKRLGNPE